MTSMMIRTNIDTAAGGALGPIFPGGLFDDISIPEEYVGNLPGVETYGTIPSRHGGVLADYLPAGLRDYLPHRDPDYITPSYGDPTIKKRCLKKLQRGDWLFFQAGLTPWQNTQFPRRANYIIGYLTVDRLVDFSEMDEESEEFQAEWAALQRNVHVGWRQETDTFVVVGSKDDSPLLTRAFPFTELRPDRIGRPIACITREMEEVLGIKGSVQRSMPRSIPAANARRLWELLQPYR